MKLKVPFKYSVIHIEKELDFVFRIGTLEDACDILGCGLYEIGEKNPFDVNVAILYSAYVIGCEKRGKRKRYKLLDAAFWVEHMSQTTRTQFTEAVAGISGKLRGESQEEKKK